MADAPTTAAVSSINAVATPSTVQDKMHHQSKLPRHLMGGTHAMRRAEGEYLPKEQAESAEAYQHRLRRTFLFNAFKKTVADMTGKVFTKPVVLKDDVPQQIKDFCEDIDLTGRHLNVFARDVFYDGMQTGGGYILVDLPPSVQREDGAPATLADEQAAGLRPFLVYIPIENLLGWKSTFINGAETLTQVRIKEVICEPVGEFGERDVEQIKVLTPGAWVTYRKGASGDWSEYASGTSRLPEITLVPFYTNRTGFMTFTPPLEPLAELNVRHWQSQSDQGNILHVARVPILFGAGFNTDEKIIVGANSMTVSSNPLAKLTYTEHSGAAINAGDKDIANIEQQMSAMGLQLLIDKPGSQSATGEIRDDAKENSPLAMMARSLGDAIEQSFGYMAEYLGMGDDAGGSVEVNTDFGVSALRGDLAPLTQAVIAGKLDNHTYIESLIRRGVLPETTDVDVVLQRIEDDGAAAMAKMPMMNLDGPPTAAAPPKKPTNAPDGSELVQ